MVYWRKCWIVDLTEFFIFIFQIEITEFYCHSLFANFPSNQRFMKNFTVKWFDEKNVAMNFSLFHIVCTVEQRNILK